MEPTEKANENVLKRNLKNLCENKKMKNYDMKITALPCTANNYTASLFLATVTEDGIDKLHLFAKVANLTEKFRKYMPVIEMYKRESYVYQEITKIYEEIQEKYKVPVEERYKFCKFYAYNDKLLEETLILENLTARGFVVPDRFISIDWDFAQKAVTELAKFHALSFCFEREYKDNFEENIKTKEEYIFNSDSASEDESKIYNENLFHSIFKVTNQENLDKLQKYLAKFTKDLWKNQFAPSGRCALIHGDFRQSNILIKQEEGKITSLIPVDYQAVYYGSIANDLLYFIYTGSDKEFREKYYQKLLDIYYEKLGDFLSLLEMDVNEEYPKEEFDLDLIHKRSTYGLLLSIFTLPYALTEDKPNFEGNLEKLSLNLGSVFGKRFNDILEEFSKDGYL